MFPGALRMRKPPRSPLCRRRRKRRAWPCRWARPAASSPAARKAGGRRSHLRVGGSPSPGPLPASPGRAGLARLARQPHRARAFGGGAGSFGYAEGGAQEGAGLSQGNGRRLLFLLVVTLLVLPQAQPAVQPSESFLRSAGPRHNSLKIVGSVVFPVKVYVKLNHDSPHILCLTNHLQNLELIDPVFQWNGPGGGLSSESRSVQISPTGTLRLRHFNLSGVYTCSIAYKLTAMQPAKNLVIKYLIYAYSDPKNYYEFTARYHAAPCNSSRNTSFEKALLQILSKLVAELSCEVTLIKSECHHVKMQRGGLQNEIFFTFSVASLDRENHNRLCQQSACDASHRLNKAKHLIERYFKQQVKINRESSEPLPEIYYIEGTLQMVWVDRCYPGYGMNALIHPDCPECCVACRPGSYNPSNGIHCRRCDSSLIYGATKC